jgi:hypothetical protein
MESLRGETTRVLPQKMRASHLLALESSQDLIQQRRTMLDQQSSHRLTGRAKEGSQLQRYPFELSERSVQELFTEFLSDLQSQRQALQRDQRNRFDSLWGLTAAGEFPQLQSRTPHLPTAAVESLDPSTVIQTEFRHVCLETKKHIDKLSTAPAVEAGLEILHLFILDLLGRDTAVAKIFLSKSEEDFRHSMVVSRGTKLFAWCLVVVLNLLFVFFSLLRGIQRGDDWQRLYLLACVVQFLVEFLFYETTECAFIHFIIPDLARYEIRSVSFTLQQILQNLWVTSTGPPPLLDVPSYLYVSVNVANHFPHLLESSIIRSYHTHSPGEFAKKWKPTFKNRMFLSLFGGGGNGSGSGSVGRNRTRYFPLTTLLVKGLQQFGSVNLSLQRGIVHLVQPLIVSATILLFVYLKHHPLYFIGLGLIFLAGLVFFIRQLLKEFKEDDERVSHIHPGEAEAKSGAGQVSPTTNAPVRAPPAIARASVHLGKDSEDEAKDVSLRWDSDSSPSEGHSANQWEEGEDDSDDYYDDEEDEAPSSKEGREGGQEEGSLASESIEFYFPREIDSDSLSLQDQNNEAARLSSASEEFEFRASVDQQASSERSDDNDDDLSSQWLADSSLTSEEGL